MSPAAQPLPLVFVLRQGQSLVRQGAPHFGMFKIHLGRVRETVVTPDGRELMLGLLGPGDTVGGVPGTRSDATVSADRPSQLSPIPREDMAREISARVGRVASLASDLAWLSVPDRLESRLLELARRFGRPAPGGTAVGLRLTQEDLAKLTGTTRESANRALQTLARQGRVDVINRGQYVLKMRALSSPRR
jgi:CRP-like cAMP-binding protein